MSYLQIYYHIVFSTKNRTKTLLEPKRKLLYNYLWGILKNKKCHLYRIGGIEDHVHIFTSLHPTINLSELIRDLKTCSAVWIKEEKVYRDFYGWQKEYSAFTKSYSQQDSVIDYIKKQVEHHKKESSVDELKRLLAEEGICFDEKYLK